MAKKAGWIVRLGAHEWSRYTYRRLDGDPLCLLGSVKRGQQVGALAITDDGRYVQVVGDFIVSLNNSQITAAVAKAAKLDPYAAVRTVPRAVAAPVVIVKRRRVFVPTDAHLPRQSLAHEYAV